MEISSICKYKVWCCLSENFVKLNAHNYQSVQQEKTEGEKKP